MCWGGCGYTGSYRPNKTLSFRCHCKTKGMGGYYETVKTLVCLWRNFCPDCRDTFPLSLRLDGKKLFCRAIRPCQRIGMGAYEAAVFPHAPCILCAGPKVEGGVPLHRPCALLWDFGRDFFHTGIFLWIYSGAWERHFFLRHCLLFLKRCSGCFYCLPAGALLQAAKIRKAPLLGCVGLVPLFPCVYVPSAGICFVPCLTNGWKMLELE